MIKFRDLEKVRVVIKNATGLDITYSYDDLVFPEHAAFMIKFDDSNEDNLFCYFHEDCVGDNRKNLYESLAWECDRIECSLKVEGSFNLKQVGEQVELRFM